MTSEGAGGGGGYREYGGFKCLSREVRRYNRSLTMQGSIYIKFASGRGWGWGEGGGEDIRKVPGRGGYVCNDCHS